MGVELAENQRLAKDLKEAETDEDVQKLLNQVSPSFLRHHAKGENSLLVKPATVVEPRGYYYTPRIAHFFVDIWHQDGLPMGLIERSPKLPRRYPQRYAFLLRRHGERARDILESSSELQEFKIEHLLQQVYGSEEERPPIKDVVNGRGFGRTWNVFKSCGVVIGLNGWEWVDFLNKECHVPIFRLIHHGGKEVSLFHHSGDEGELVQYILQRKLRLSNQAL